jgi:hypothetical protein
MAVGPSTQSGRGGDLKPCSSSCARISACGCQPVRSRPPMSVRSSAVTPSILVAPAAHTIERVSRHEVEQGESQVDVRQPAEHSGGAGVRHSRTDESRRDRAGNGDQKLPCRVSPASFSICVIPRRYCWTCSPSARTSRTPGQHSFVSISRGSQIASSAPSIGRRSNRSCLCCRSASCGSRCSHAT